MRCIYNFYWIVCLICSSSTFGQESNFYFPGSSRQDRYLPNYQPQTQQNALYQQQFPSSFSNPLYTDDLHNQDLRLGNQFPLNPSYNNRASTNSQPSQFRLPQPTVDTFASYITKPNRPQLVQPSPFGHQKTPPAGTSFLRFTQRPPQQYSHVHSHDSSRNNNHEQFLGQITLQSPNTDYTDSTTYQFPPHSSLVDHFSSQKTQAQPWKNQKPSFRLPEQNNNFEELSESDLLLEDQTVKQRPQNRKKSNQPFQKNILGNPQNRFVPLNQESNSYKSNLNTFIKPSKPINNFFQTSSIEIPKNHRDRVKLDYNNKNINNFDYDTEMQPLIEDEVASENNYDNENIKIIPPNVDSEESTLPSIENHQNDDYDTVDAGDNTDTPTSPILNETTLENESSTITELQETTATSLSESVALENDHTSTNTLNSDVEHTTDYPEISTDAKNDDTTITISKNDEPILLGEAVVSVVTTKSVVNGTISIPQPTQATINLTTEQMKNMENQNDTATTESWVVVSSIQTSRSASGARFLPPEIAANIDDNNQYISTTTVASKNEVNVTEPNEIKSSTESIIDKLDRVQSELSSGLLISDFKNDNITVITDHTTDDNTTVTPPTSTTNVLTTSSSPVFIRKFSPYLRPTTTQRPKKSNIFENIKMDDLSGLLPPGFKPRYTNNRRKTTTKSTESPLNTSKEKQTNSQSQEQSHNRNASSGRSFNKNIQNKIIVQDDISAFLPPGYKQNFSANLDNTKKLKNDNKLTSTTTENSILSKAKPVDISAFLPPGYKLQDTSEELNKNEPKQKTTSTEKSVLLTAKPVDISAFLPPGYKLKTTTETPILANAKPVDISAFLPPGYSASTPSPTTQKSLLANAKPVDIKAFLPPGYKLPSSTTENSLISNASLVDISKFLPADFKFPPKENDFSEEIKSLASSTSVPLVAASTTSANNFKVVFPSRPGGRKPITRLTTPKTLSADAPQAVLPAIRKGPPTRATTEFTGWPTPSTTPISIEKLLEAARTATESASPNLPSSEPTTSTTTTTTTTTTTPRPTTPGVCKHECDLAATIKLVGGAKWVPELLNHNTKEWQLLANEVQTQLESAYIKSEILNRWFKKVRIEEFSEGSVLVDYIIELNDVSRQVDTQELKRLFHNALNPVPPQPMTTSDISLEQNETSKNESSSEIEMDGKLKLGNFIVDPNYTDFIVIPKQIAPTVGYADENVLLPQWAIAVIVIGLASLLFVIIFGVTVLVNRQKNAKKRQPAPLTEDMLNELNKNHMNGIDNYGADDLYNMEDVWNDRGYDIKLPKKRSVVSLQENHAPNLYDSWRSEWNGYYYNAYYGNNPSGSASATYGRRRSDYDTNF